jgi:hypothetical protein
LGYCKAHIFLVRTEYYYGTGASAIEGRFKSAAGWQAHWANAFCTEGEKELTWFQEDPAPSLDLIWSENFSLDAAIDIGGGTSFLVDKLRVL